MNMLIILVVIMMQLQLMIYETFLGTFTMKKNNII